jgi:hypothetical protein
VRLVEVENFTAEENQSHICHMILQTKELFYDHIEKEHDEYLLGMLEVLSQNSFQNAE